MSSECGLMLLSVYIHVYAKQMLGVFRNGTDSPVGIWFY